MAQSSQFIRQVQFVKKRLIEKVTSGVCLFTDLAIDICNYLDKQQDQSCSVKNEFSCINN